MANGTWWLVAGRLGNDFTTKENFSQCSNRKHNAGKSHILPPTTSIHTTNLSPTTENYNIGNCCTPRKTRLGPAPSFGHSEMHIPKVQTKYFPLQMRFLRPSKKWDQPLSRLSLVPPVKLETLFQGLKWQPWEVSQLPSWRHEAPSRKRKDWMDFDSKLKLPSPKTAQLSRHCLGHWQKPLTKAHHRSLAEKRWSECNLDRRKLLCARHFVMMESESAATMIDPRKFLYGNERVLLPSNHCRSECHYLAKERLLHDVLFRIAYLPYG